MKRLTSLVLALLTGTVANAQNASEAVNSFAFDLYRNLKVDGNENLVYSPFSILPAFGMVTIGAKSETQKQLNATFHFGNDVRIHRNLGVLQRDISSSTSDAITISVANKAWLQTDYNILSGYRRNLKKLYRTSLYKVDFKSNPESSRQTINTAIEHDTKQYIKNLLPQGSIDNLTRLVLTNAVYFKAAWLYPFNPENTNTGTFTLLDGTQVQVPMMHSSNTLKAYVSDDVQLVELPYEGGTYSMVVVMPKAGSMEAFEQTLTLESLQNLLGQMQRASVTLSMSKFKFEAAFNLNATMQALGMKDAFDAENADFSGMDGKKDLSITSMLHKAYIDVNEEGTEAAAATAVVVGLTSAPGQSYTHLHSITHSCLPFVIMPLEHYSLWGAWLTQAKLEVE